MQESKHTEAIREVMQTIDEALSSKDILIFQRRLASMISLGLQHIVEIHLHRLNVIKPGAYVKHDWFFMGDRNLKTKFSTIISKPYEKIKNINEIVSLARSIEADRNEILYGAPLADGKRLREKIDCFLEIKKIIEETGEINES